MFNLSKLTHYIGYYFLAGSFLILISCGQGMSEQQMLQNARTYMDKGDLVAASIELRNTLQKNNENAEARYLLGSISLEIGDLASAEKEFSRASQAGWNDEDLQIGLARVFIARKELQKLLDEITIKNSWSPSTRANISGLRALAEAGLGHQSQAITTLDEGRSYKANAFQVLKTTAMFQLAAIQDGDASDTLKAALSLYPDNPELLLLQAANALQNKDHARAIDAYQRVIRLDPATLITANGRNARIGLARLQIINKNYAEAKTTLTPLLKQNDKDPSANFLGGLVAFSQGDYNHAEDHIRKLLDIAPDHHLSQQLMGKIKFALKDFDQAAQYLSAYLNAVPNDLAVRKLLTRTYIALNQPEQARSILQTALSSSPDDAETLILLSQIEFSRGNMNAGMQALRKASESSPNNIALHKQLAKAYIAAGKTGLALTEIKTFQNLSKDTEQAQKLTITAYLNAGEKNKAINIANEMLAKNPQDPALIALNGTLYAASGNEQQARMYYNKALQLEDNHPSAAIGLARIESKDGNSDKAIELYKGLVEADKGGTVPMLALAELATQQGRTNDMLSWLEKARNAAPGETRSHIILTNYYLLNNQPDKAESYALEAIKISPEQADLIALHGKVLIAQKRFNEALPPLKKLVRKSPDSANAQVLLGETLLRLGMMEDAREHLEKALKTQGNHVLAMSLMANIELNEGKLDRSLVYAKRLQKVQPQLYIGYMLEGDVLIAKQDFNRAHSVYSHAWKQQQTAELAIRLFNASKRSVKLEDAIRPLLAWLNDNPNDNNIRFVLAAAYQDAEENDKAIREYKILLAQIPDNGVLLNNLAWLYLQKGDPKALELAERAYRSLPHRPDIQDTYGWILVQQGQAAKGKRLIKQAMDQLPDNLEIRYHYATALLKSGSTKEGQQILEQLLRENAQFNGRNEALQLLGKQDARR